MTDDNLSNNELGTIQPCLKTGDELFLNAEGHTNSLKDYWAWAHSDLVDNTERGKLAEYIVAMALGVKDQLSMTWDNYDLLSKEGIRIEVKTSAYIQTWKQWRFSALRFGIGPTHAWDEETGLYAEEEKRQADVYVFCVLKHKDQATLNPLDLSQWAFYVLATSTLDAAVPKQKNIALSGLLAIGAKPCSFSDLYNTVKQEAGFC